MGSIVMGRADDTIWEGNLLNEMFMFRYRVFYQRLGWEVETSNGMERDWYDQLNPVYIVSKCPAKTVEGCWRILPTSGAYMLKDTFPQLLGGNEAPQHDDVWELSRFAVASTDKRDLAQANLSAVTVGMIRSAVSFARHRGIRSYVTVISVALERLMKKAGIKLRRLGNGNAQRIDKVLTVACCIDVNDALNWLVAIRRKPCSLGGGLRLRYVGEKPCSEVALAGSLDSRQMSIKDFRNRAHLNDKYTFNGSYHYMHDLRVLKNEVELLGLFSSILQGGADIRV